MPNVIGKFMCNLVAYTDSQTRVLLMLTTVKDFYIIKVLEDDTDKLIGIVLYGEVVADETGRFHTGSFVCSSLISSINPETKIVTTHSASQYLLASDTGKKSLAYLSEIPLLREGHTPAQVKALRSSSKQSH